MAVVISNRVMKKTHYISKLPNQNDPTIRRKRSTIVKFDFDKSNKTTILNIDEQNIPSNDDKSNNNPLSLPALPPHGSTTAISNTNTSSSSHLKKSSGASLKIRENKVLFEKRRVLSDMVLMFAMAGLVLMILESELTMYKVYTKSSFISYFMKSLISFTTLVLVFLLLTYHLFVLKIYMNDNNLTDWRIAITYTFIFQVIIETLVCLIHPVPVDASFVWSLNTEHDEQYKTAIVPVDLILSLPMFLRLYLICRSMLLHSKLYSGVSSRSIGAFNRITFNTAFILKTLMTMYPGVVLIVFSLTLFVISSWTLRACESYFDDRFSNILNSMWAISVTFLTIGYGDIVPNTYCGRAICIVSGFMGVASSAIMIAVLSQKLELKRSEEHVLNFITENELKKRLKNAAANVIQQAWLVYKHSKNNNMNKRRYYERKLFESIRKLKRVKLDRKNFYDNNNAYIDISNTQKDIFDALIQVDQNQKSLRDKISLLESQIEIIQKLLDAWPKELGALMESNRNTIQQFGIMFNNSNNNNNNTSIMTTSTNTNNNYDNNENNNVPLVSSEENSLDDDNNNNNNIIK